jgi:hypothetical protein
MIHILITVLVIAVVVGIIWWVCDFLPVPEPLNKLIKILSIVIAVIAIVYLLLGLPGVAISAALPAG